MEHRHEALIQTPPVSAATALRREKLISEFKGWLTLQVAEPLEDVAREAHLFSNLVRELCCKLYVDGRSQVDLRVALLAISDPLP